MKVHILLLYVYFKTKYNNKYYVDIHTQNKVIRMNTSLNKTLRFMKLLRASGYEKDIRLQNLKLLIKKNIGASQQTVDKYIQYLRELKFIKSGNRFETISINWNEVDRLNRRTRIQCPYCNNIQDYRANRPSRYMINFVGKNVKCLNCFKYLSVEKCRIDKQ